MTAQTPFSNWTEIPSLLKKSGQVTLDANGNGVINFDPDHANQRWEITKIVISTNQASTATLVPQVTLGINAVSLPTLSQGNLMGQSWNGNQDTFTGQIDLGPCDFLSVIFAPPAGQAGGGMSGVIASAVLTGMKYTRRG